MSDAVQQIKDKLGIVDVVSKYVQLQPAGKHMKACCPFHNEKTPSFTVSPDRGMFYCYGCQKGGDVFTFIQEIEGLDFKGALTQLAEQAGVELVAEDPAKKSARDRHYDVLNTAATFWQEKLTTCQEAEAYLESRGVTARTIGAWRIGYAPGPPVGGWRDTKQHLLDAGYTEAEIEAVGLSKQSSGGKESYDVFRHRVVFPLFDPAGRVVGFSGRFLGDEKEVPKYVNSPETELYQKSQLLYGYDKAKSGIRTYDFTLIVEGQFDVVMAHQAGYTNTVAVSGTALTEHHVQLLQRLSNRVVLALDGDAAGIKAVQRSAVVMLERGMDVKVAALPADQDPADCIQADLPAFKRAIAKAAHVIEFLLARLRAEHADDRAYKLAVRETVLPFLLAIPSAIDREHFVGVVAKAIEVGKPALNNELERLARETKQQPTTLQNTNRNHNDETPATPVRAASDRQQQYQYMYGRLLAYTEMIPNTAQAVLQDWLETVTGESSSEAIQSLDPKLRNETQFTLEAEIQSLPKTQLYADIAHTMTKFTEQQYRQQLQALRSQLMSGEHEADEIQRQLSIVHKKIGEINFPPEALQG